VAICGAGGPPTSRVDHDVNPISFFLKRQMIKKPYMLYADRHKKLIRYLSNTPALKAPTIAVNAIFELN
jgi:hypothetical protein